MNILFPRINLQVWGLDDVYERFNFFRVFIGPANPVITETHITFPYSYSFGLSIPFCLYEYFYKKFGGQRGPSSQD
jgi:hypothetical protein